MDSTTKIYEDERIKYVCKLPEINTSDKFLILRTAKDNLAYYWWKYIREIHQMAVNNQAGFKKLRDEFRKAHNRPLNDYQTSLKEMLGLGGALKVISLIDNKKFAPLYNVSLKPVAQMDYTDLVNIYFEEDNGGVHSRRRSTVGKFFIYLWQEGKIMLPLERAKGQQRNRSWNTISRRADISRQFEEWIMQKNLDIGQAKLRVTTFNAIVSSTGWHDIKEISASSLDEMQKHIYELLDSDQHIPKPYLRTINDFRRFLILNGRMDVAPPMEVSKIKRDRVIQKDKHGNIIHFFDDVDLEAYPNLTELVSHGDGYAKMLSIGGLAQQSILRYLIEARNFLDLLMEEYPEEEINIDLLEKLFDPSYDRCLLNIYENGHSKKYAVQKLLKVVRFLVYCEMFTEKMRKNVPKLPKEIKLEPYRDAMPAEMVRHILDILKNRPPRSYTRWDKDRADTSWWGHEEYPIFPLMLMFHYYIPLRGNQIRYLCRKNSFVFNEEGKIDKFVINTDKNVNRKYLQEIPCVWDDLQIFVPFLKWHKEYFPNLPPIKYQDDDNAPWEEIEPLMILPDNFKPVSNNTHYQYHKKVLCVYQLEVMQQAEAEGRDDYPVVAWTKSGAPFFKSAEEIDKATVAQMRDIEIMYDIHSLRVTGATRYLESGVGFTTVMELTGHMSVETLSRIYIRLTRKEKETKLRSAVDQIYFGDKSTLVESSKDLIRGELTRAYHQGEETLNNTLSDNRLFSMHRKITTSGTKASTEAEKGMSILQKKHPTSWMPMIHGICPAVKCPEGRENKCSLCPYLITGSLFVEGVTHQLNRAFAEFQRNSIRLKKEEENGYKNHALSEELETKLEEMIGWQEILKRIENDMLESGEHSQTEESEEKAIVEKAKSIFGMETEATDLVYLKNAYDAQLMGVEQDIFGLKSLTILAIKVAVKAGETERVAELTEDETKAIDMLMQCYKGESTGTKLVNSFMSSIGMLPKPK